MCDDDDNKINMMIMMMMMVMVVGVVVIIGSLSKDIGDVNVRGKKVKVYIGKTITLHVHHAFLCISLPSLFE